MKLRLRYESYQYFYPPRAERAIPPERGEALGADLATYENLGWCAQVKKNGTCNVIAISPEGERQMICMPRHGPKQPHRAWRPTDASRRMFKRLPGKGWYVFVAELLHSKTPTIKDTNYVFDMLVDDGAYLLGTSFAGRQARLGKIFLPMVKGKPATMVSHYVIDDHLWLARTYPAGSDFKRMWKGLENDEDEGLVLRNPNARLEHCGSAGSNASWLVKCRKEHKNYAF